MSTAGNDASANAIHVRSWAALEEMDASLQSNDPLTFRDTKQYVRSVRAHQRNLIRTGNPV